MTQRMFRICILLTLGFTFSQTILPAQERNGLEGIWSVSVKVINCQTGAAIRTVASLQQFRRGGSMIETANTASRGISEGVWGYAGDDDVAALYWFYRYNPDGTFASRANITDKIVLGSNGQFTSSGVVLDYDANGNLLTTGCFTHSATRLTAGFETHGNDWNHWGAAHPLGPVRDLFPAHGQICSSLWICFRIDAKRSASCTRGY